jgi:ABC transporter substrate binding protein
MAQNLTREEGAVALSYVFAGVGGYYASKQGGLGGVFRCATDSADWKHALSEVETFTVLVHPHDPNLVFAGTADGVYRSTDRGQNFRRADFPDRGVQVWSFLQDDTDPKLMLAGGSPVSIYRSNDGGASWKHMPDPHLPVHAKMCRLPAIRYSLPSIFDVREFAAEGGLMSYGTSQTKAFQQAAGYIGRILNGATPAELPIVQPTRFELVINRTTASALGLKVPDRLVALADEVIQ